MALTEKEEFLYEILPTGYIQERKTTVILRDGVVIARNHHRRVIEPGADISAESAELQGYAEIAHTQERIDVVVARKQAVIDVEAARIAAVDLENNT